jgi:hypothetical protein
MKVRIRYEDRDGNQAEQVFENALKVEIEAPEAKLEVVPAGKTLHLDWVE